MSHYLKILCDLIFKVTNFRNEIAWCYRGAGYPKMDFGKRHDVILRYSKTANYIFNLDDVREEYAETTKARFKHHIGNIRNGKDFGVQKLHPLGKQPDDWWQIQPIAPSARERLGYPTQKPEALLDKIVKASSNKGSLVADFFGGCGTTISVAQNLKRKWLAVDISHLAIGLIERRLINSYGKTIKNTYEIDGLPKDISSAKQLAEGTSRGRLKFQDWIIEAMIGGVHNPRKTADGGWDGHLTFEMPNHLKEIILIEVKSGNVNVKNLREFIQVINKQKAAIGVFVCFDENVTKPMRLEAKDAGYYKKDIFGANYDRIQIMTVEKLLEGEVIKMPNILTTTFKTAKEKKENGEQPDLFKDK